METALSVRRTFSKLIMPDRFPNSTANPIYLPRRGAVVLLALLEPYYKLLY